MAYKKLYDTSLPNNWSTTLDQQYLFDIAPEHYDKLLSVIMIATSEILSSAKLKQQPVTVTYRKANGELVAAATVEFFPNDDASKPGNWALAWTFDESDIPENALKITQDDPNVLVYYRAVAGSKWNIEFDSTSVVTPLVNTTLLEFKKWLDENAVEGEEVGIEIPALCTGAVSIENGVKVFALIPAGEVKMLIKDDTAIEV